MTMPTKLSTAFDYSNEFWNIADYVRDVIRPADYNKLILPLVLLRRLECALEPTREAVLALKDVLGQENERYKAVSGKSFYNVTKFRLNDLGNTNTLEALEAYINGFSPNAREILQKFRLLDTIKRWRLLKFLIIHFSLVYNTIQNFSPV